MRQGDLAFASTRIDNDEKVGPIVKVATAWILHFCGLSRQVFVLRRVAIIVPYVTVYEADPGSIRQALVCGGDG